MELPKRGRCPRFGFDAVVELLSDGELPHPQHLR